MKSLRTEAHVRLVAELRSVRRDADLTQLQLAARLKVPQSWVSKIETGERKIDVIEFASWISECGAADRMCTLLGELVEKPA